MSSKIDDGGPAFPVSDTVHPSGQVQYGFNGMTLRDWFAGQALAGMLANQSLVNSAYDMAMKDGDSSAKKKAEYCYEHADAMLAERAKKKEAQS